MRVARIGLLGALGLCLAFSGVEAQQRSQGWIGISFDIEARRGQSSRVVITDVIEGSPAQAAGLREGDRLLAVNQLKRTRELAELSERLRLRPGDEVRMTILRDGRRRSVEMRAAQRPSIATVGASFSMTFEPDSFSDAMYRAMDSLRLRFSAMESPNVQVATRTAPDGSFRIVTSAGSNSSPFEFFVYRGEEHDSLRREMAELNVVIESLEDAYRDRTRELERRGARVVERDTRLRELERQIEEESRRSATLMAAMAEAARSTAGLRYVVPTPTAPEVPVVVADGNRPLTPYLLGRNRVAGAEVIDMRPQLAEVFNVEGGVLVVDVSRRTPAGMAGIQPGDVIVRMDQVAVRSVEDFRFGVSQADATLPIELIRRGSTIQVLLRR